MTEKSFFVWLTNQDRLRVRFTLQGGEPVEVMVQLECVIDGKWVPCRRYDSAHGVFHVHHAPWDRDQDRRQRVSVADLQHALSLAITDLRANWTRYRGALEAWHARGSR